MRYAICLAIGLLSAPIPALADPRADFVREYLFQLSTIQGLRVEAQERPTKHDLSSVLNDCIRTGTILGLEFRSDAAAMQQTHLTGDVQKFPGLIGDLLAEEATVYDKMTEVCSAMVGGPKPGVDYAALSAQIPKIAANLEFLDQALLKASPAVTAALVSDKANAHGGLDRLIITRAEKNQLLGLIASGFKQTEGKDSTYIENCARVIKAFLGQPWKFVDDP